MTLHEDDPLNTPAHIALDLLDESVLMVRDPSASYPVYSDQREIVLSYLLTAHEAAFLAGAIDDLVARMKEEGHTDNLPVKLHDKLLRIGGFTK